MAALTDTGSRSLAGFLVLAASCEAMGELSCTLPRNYEAPPDIASASDSARAWSFCNELPCRQRVYPSIAASSKQAASPIQRTAPAPKTTVALKAMKPRNP